MALRLPILVHDEQEVKRMDDIGINKELPLYIGEVVVFSIDWIKKLEDSNICMLSSGNVDFVVNLPYEKVIIMAQRELQVKIN